ncbi:DUF6249 domain-containing protein [Pseudoteredinibacter isoporae]|uniref:Cell division protein FtsL n=1 Tax=Pseudoteredinibacter isoporae TaxID=570281 RepID=A0A7X0JQX8_9GAMM|nr:DUF6249 domain-containing protein [Pseudoteredinibacter isoporae]MBB6520154.1 cell division protein FtsL [Pseudoteredinibacter isoporae]NHO85726.1 hypothetical protein [Pseudoteredinibacter isoporae]NIB25822.1 hypothetical protein [Pseudoteredinibacter isoporae]
MNPLNLKQLFAALLMLCTLVGAAAVAAESETDSHRKVIVVKDGDVEKTIDLNVESGQIIVRSNEGGDNEKVTINLGSFLGENVLKEIATELEKEGVEINGKIVIANESENEQNGENEQETRVVYKEGGNIFTNSIGDFLEALVAVVAIILIFGMPVLIVGVVMYGRYKRRELINKSIDKMLESGQEIPAEIFQEATGKDEKSTLSKGVMLIAIGLGLMGFLGAVAGEVGAVGLIPALIGAAHLFIWKTEQAQQKDDNSQSA